MPSFSSISCIRPAKLSPRECRIVGFRKQIALNKFNIHRLVRIMILGDLQAVIIFFFNVFFSFPDIDTQPGTAVAARFVARV